MRYTDMADARNADGTPNMNTNAGRVLSAELATRAYLASKGRIILILPTVTVTTVRTDALTPETK